MEEDNEEEEEEEEQLTLSSPLEYFLEVKGKRREGVGMKEKGRGVEGERDRDNVHACRVYDLSSRYM